MGKITIGLARGKASLYDKRTNTNFTLENPVREVSFTNPEQLEDIVRALIANPPSLILYKGQIPEEAKQAVQNRFNTIIRGKDVRFKDLSGDIVTSPANNVLDRLDKNITQRETVEVEQEKATMMKASAMKAAAQVTETIKEPEEVKTEEVEVKAEVEKTVAAKTAAPKKTSRKKKTESDTEDKKATE